MITKADTSKSERVFSYLKKGDVKYLQYSVDVLNARGESFSSGLTQKLNREMFNIFELLVVALKSESLHSESNRTWEDNYEYKNLLHVLENKYLNGRLFSRDSELTKAMAYFAKLPDSWEFSASEYVEIFLLIAQPELEIMRQEENNFYRFFYDANSFNLFLVALELSAHNREEFLRYIRIFNNLGDTKIILSEEDMLSFMKDFEFLRTGKHINSDRAKSRLYSLFTRVYDDNAYNFAVHIINNVHTLFLENYTKDIPVDLFLDINFSRVNKEKENEYSAARKLLIDAIASSRIIERSE